MGNSFSLAPFSFKRPEKVRWLFVQTADSIVESIPSKSLRTFLKKAPQILSELGLTYEYVSVSKELFEKWYALYTEKTAQYGYKLMITPDWYDEAQQLGKIVEGVFLYKDGKLFTGAIVVRYRHERGILAYSAREHVSIPHGANSSLGTLVDYFFLCKMKEMGIQSISSGASRNAFGVFNSIGYLEFKLRMGYLPVLPDNHSLLDTVPIGSNGTVLFFATKDDMQLVLIGLRPVGTLFFTDHSAFSRKNLPFQLLEYDPTKLAA